MTSLFTLTVKYTGDWEIRELWTLVTLQLYDCIYLFTSVWKLLLSSDNSISPFTLNELNVTFCINNLTDQFWINHKYAHLFWRCSFACLKEMNAHTSSICRILQLPLEIWSPVFILSRQTRHQLHRYLQCVCQKIQVLHLWCQPTCEIKHPEIFILQRDVSQIHHTVGLTI